MQVFFFLAYLVIGLVQLFAVADGIEVATDLPAFVAMFLALLLTYIPLLGAGLGVYGAVEVWNWELLQAVLLFFWYVPVYLAFMIIGSIADRRAP